MNNYIMPNGSIIINPNESNNFDSIIRITFQGKNQLPKIMITQEFYNANNKIIYANCIYNSMKNMMIQECPIMIIENPTN